MLDVESEIADFKQVDKPNYTTNRKKEFQIHLHVFLHLEIQIELSEFSVICCRDVFLTHDDDSKFLRIPFLTQCK